MSALLACRNRGSSGSSAIYENHSPKLDDDPPSSASACRPENVQKMQPLPRRSSDRQVLLRLGMEKRECACSSYQRAMLGRASSVCLRHPLSPAVICWRADDRPSVLPQPLPRLSKRTKG